MAVCLWCCFLVRGLFYCMVLPMWEGFDEYAHFAYVQYIAEGHGWLVSRETSASREVERSIELVPMPWTSRSDPNPHETHDSYWLLPAGSRRDRERELAALGPSLAGESAIGYVPVESQQPPLNYWLMAAIYKLFSGASLTTQLGVLRILNVLLASIAVPATWVTAQRIFPLTNLGTPAFVISRAATAASVIVALQPELFFDSARVANSGLAIALYSTLSVLCLRIIDEKRGAIFQTGIVLGLGLLTKAFFLAAVPVVILIMVWSALRRSTHALSVIGGLALTISISGWWYARSLRLTGSLSGVMQAVALRQVPLIERLRHIRQVDWRSAANSAFLSHIWFGGWSFLQLRAWIYHFFALLAFLALLGLFVTWTKHAPVRQHLLVMAGIYGAFCAALAYHVLLTFLANGVSSSAGWYLCAVGVPEAVLASLGLWVLTPARIRPYGLGAVALSFAALDLYGMFFVAIPYYTGMIAHGPADRLAAFHWAALARIGGAEALHRLAIDKPSAIGADSLVAAGCAYVIATSALVALAFYPAGTKETVTV